MRRMQESNLPGMLKGLSLYKLAYVLAKNSLPCQCRKRLWTSVELWSLFLKFSNTCHQTIKITERAPESYHKEIYPETQEAIRTAPCWSLICDESLDDCEPEEIETEIEIWRKRHWGTRFWELKRIVGHPNATTVVSSF